MSRIRRATIAVAAVALAGVVAGVSAQQAGFSRTILQQADISAPGREAVTAIAEIQPGASIGRHTHPGEEIGYVLEGTVTVEQEGKPAVSLGTGKTFLIPAGIPHGAANKGSVATRILATYIVEKGKPLATPVAAR